MNQPSAESIVRRATAAFNSGRADEARQLCEQGLIRAPDEPMLHHLLAAVLFSRNDIQPARQHVETSLASKPGNAAAHLLAARIARAAKDFDAALLHLDRAIAIAPQRDAFVEKARTLDQAGQRLQAREAWRAILDVVPQHPEAAARFGRLAWEDGAMPAYAEAYRLRPQAFGKIAMALTSASHGRLWIDEASLRRSLGGQA
jgi:tetratricopeptide (TPR) repeat protein